MASAIVVVTMTGLMSCIKDSLDGCLYPSSGNTRLIVKLDNTANADQYQIDSTYVYVFDANGRFVTSATGGAYDPTKTYEFFFNLENGDYHFIVWANPGDVYNSGNTFEQCEEQGLTMSDLIYYMNVNGADVLTQTIPDLLYGAKEQDILEDQENIVTVYMIPQTYRINVKVLGLPITTDEFRFTITDNNSHYNFDNSIVPNIDDFTYIRDAYQQEDEELNVSFKVLRLEDDRSPDFLFMNSTEHEVLFHDNLVEVIRRAYRQSGQVLNFNRIHTFNIVLTFDIRMGMSVTINGWQYNHQLQPL